MDFTEKDKATLLKIYGGVQKTLDEDIRQLEEAADVTEYTFGKEADLSDEREITRETAIRKLGRETWLSGLVRSAFHWTAMRYIDPKDPLKGFVWFNSKRLFK